RMLGAEPAVRSELYATLGSLYQKLGRFDRADTLLSSALDERKARVPEGAETAESLVALGLLRVEEARLPEAEKLVRQGLARLSRLSPRDEAAVARAKLALGRVLEARGAYPAAIAELDGAARLDGRRGAESPELAADLSELA